MLKFLFVLVFAVFSAGSSGALDLQGGDLITAADGPIMRIDTVSGTSEIISGCPPDDHFDQQNGGFCISGALPVGSGPPWHEIMSVLVAQNGKILVRAAVNADFRPPGDSTDGYFEWYLIEIDAVTGDRTILSSAMSYDKMYLVPSFYATASMPGLSGWAIPLLVGFLLGASYMKGKYDGRVVA